MLFIKCFEKQSASLVGVQVWVGEQSLFFYYLLIIFHTSNCKPTFAPHCIKSQSWDCLPNLILFNIWIYNCCIYLFIYHPTWAMIKSICHFKVIFLLPFEVQCVLTPFFHSFTSLDVGTTCLSLLECQSFGMILVLPLKWS